MPSRLARSLATAAGALLLALLLNLVLVQTAAMQPHVMQPQPAAKPQLTPTAAPTDWFSATVLLTVSAATPAFGDSFTVTAQLVTTGTCGLSPLSAVLMQSEPLFTFVDPPGVSLPGAGPLVWRLAATASGATIFTVNFFGQTTCAVSEPMSVNSEPQPVTVAPAPVLVSLPFVSHDVRPLPLTDLGTLGGSSGIAYAINNRGEVVGSSPNAAGQVHAFLWRNGVMTDLGTLGGDASGAVAINERGQVAGSSALEGSPPMFRGFFWMDGVMTDLGSLGGGESSVTDINLAGQVIGSSQTMTETPHGFVWANGVMTDLGTLGGWRTVAADINDRGEVAGYTTTGHGIERAFLWRDGVLINLHPEGAIYSMAYAINERGQVVGTYVADGRMYGFLWENWVLTPFLAPGGVGISQIDDFNERGQVVGVYSTGTELHGFLWEESNTDEGIATELGIVRFPGLPYYCPALINDDGLIVSGSPTGPILRRNGSITPLDLLSDSGLYNLDCPRAINDRGQIVGASLDDNGGQHAVLWDAGK